MKREKNWDYGTSHCMVSAVSAVNVSGIPYSYAGNISYTLPYNAKKRCDGCGAPYKPGATKCEYCGGER